jgi:hypothetical protein
MSQITITNFADVSAVPPSSQDPAFRDPIEDLLIRIGKIVLKDELHSGPMSIIQVARVAQKYKIRWKHKTHKSTALAELISKYHERNDSIRGDGVQVKCWMERDDYRKELRISFHSYNPAMDKFASQESTT